MWLLFVARFLLITSVREFDDPHSFNNEDIPSLLRETTLPLNLDREFDAMSIDPQTSPIPPPPQGVDAELKFFKEAVIDIYNVRNDNRLLDIILDLVDSQVSLQQFEKRLIEKFERRFLNISQSIKTAIHHGYTIRWKCHIFLNLEEDISEMRFLPPEIDSSTTLYQNSFTSHRFVFATILVITNGESNINSKNKHYPSVANLSVRMKEVFEKGICFAGVNFFFLGGELTKSKSLKRLLRHSTITSNSNNHKNQGNNKFQQVNGIVGWFFNENPSYLPDFARSAYETSVMRHYLGNLTVEKPGKCNARIKLGFSSIYPFPIQNDQIQIIPDIPNPNNPKKVMTDGCGLINLDLAKRFPYSVKNGRKDSDRDSSMPAPLMVQVRCASAKGLFKGCLLVTDDLNLCPNDTILFRKSMQKAGPSPYFNHAYPILGIADTFEHSMIMKSEKAPQKGNYSIYLNRETCLLLHYLKVPEDYFLEMMRRDLLLLVNCLKSIEDGRKLIKQMIKRSQNRLNNPNLEILEDYEEDLDEETDCTIIYEDDKDSKLPFGRYQNDVNSFHYLDLSDDPDLSSSPYQHTPMSQEERELSNRFYHNLLDCKEIDEKRFLQHVINDDERFTTAESLRSLMMVGMTIEEFHVKKLFKQMMKQRFQDLLKFNLQIHNAIYLVGAPDPYQFLAPDEVYISLPNDRRHIIRSEDVLMSSKMFLHCKSIRGKVVVTRHPLTHPGDIRVFTAVAHPALERSSIAYSSGGAIIFSTQGDRAAADKMSGGDYDGDQYLIIYNDEDGLLDHIQPIDPCVEDEEPVSTTQQSPKSTNTFEGRRICTHTGGEKSCRECSDEMGAEILKSLLITVKTSCVGIYSNAWLKWSDVDPLGREALECGRIKRIALDAPKTGMQVPENPTLIRTAPLPHYWRDESNGNTLSSRSSYEEMKGASSKGSSPTSITSSASTSPMYTTENYVPPKTVRSSYGNGNKKIIHSKSILGKLFDEAEGMYNDHLERYLHEKSKEPGNNNNQTKSDISIDFDCVVVSELDFVDRGSDVIWNQWKLPDIILKEYCQFKQKDFQVYEAQHLLSNLLNLLLQNTIIKEIILDFIKDLMDYKKQFAEILNPTSSNNNNNKRYLDGETAIAEMKLNHYRYYLNYIEQLSNNIPQIPKKLIRLRIAGLIYLVTYAEAAKKNTEAVSYCWELCKRELLYNKNQIHLRRNQYSLYDLIVPQEITNWC